MKNLGDDKLNLKDHVEHLRTIHFALIGTCIALLITVQFLPGVEWFDARDQLMKLTNADTPLTKDLNNEKLKELERGVIGEVIKCYKDTVNKLDCSSASTPPQMVGAYPLKDYWKVTSPPIVSPEIEHKQIRFEGDGTFCCINFDFGDFHSSWIKVKFKPAINEGFSSLTIPSLPDKPTLNDYQAIWNSFVANDSMQIIWRLNFSFDDSDSNNLLKRGGINVDTSPNYVSDIIHLSKTNREGIYETSDLSSYINGELPPTVKLKVTVDRKVVTVDPGLWVTKDKRYQEKHANLLFIASPEQRNLMGSTFQAAQEHIENQIKIRTESISVVGLKIPSELLLSWGVVIIITLQLYLLMHLKFYCKLLSINQNYEVAWIGYYTDLLSKTIFITTVLVIPVITVIVLVSRVTRDPSFQYSKYLLPALLSVIVSAVISSSTRAFIFEVWKRHEDSESEEMEKREV